MLSWDIHGQVVVRKHQGQRVREYFFNYDQENILLEKQFTFIKHQTVSLPEVE